MFFNTSNIFKLRRPLCLYPQVILILAKLDKLLPFNFRPTSLVIAQWWRPLPAQLGELFPSCFRSRICSKYCMIYWNWMSIGCIIVLWTTLAWCCCVMLIAVRSPLSKNATPIKMPSASYQHLLFDPQILPIFLRKASCFCFLGMSSGWDISQFIPAWYVVYIGTGRGFDPFHFFAILLDLPRLTTPMYIGVVSCFVFPSFVEPGF